MNTPTPDRPKTERPKAERPEASASLVSASDRGPVSSRGTFVSLAVHAALLAAAVLLSQTAMDRDEGPRARVTFFDEARPVEPTPEPGGGGGGMTPPVPPTPPVASTPPRIRRPTPVREVEELEFEPVPHLEGPTVDPTPLGPEVGTTGPSTGTGPGFGTGTGTGVGSGTGPGIGSGTGPGVGGGRPIYLPAGMEAPRRLTGAMPTYTRAAREARFQGELIARLEIAEDGTVRDVRIMRGHPLLDDEIITTLRRWRFSPPRIRGVPTSIYLIQRIAFQL